MDSPPTIYRIVDDSVKEHPNVSVCTAESPDTITLKHSDGTKETVPGIIMGARNGIWKVWVKSVTEKRPVKQYDNVQYVMKSPEDILIQTPSQKHWISGRILRIELDSNL